MAKKKEKKPEVVQDESFSLINERDALIDKVYEKAEAENPEQEVVETEDEVDEIDEIDEVDEPESTIPEIEDEIPEQEPSDYEKLKSDYENLKGQNTEEREKRKANKRELENTQAQLHEVLQEFKALSEQLEKVKSGEVDEYEDPGMNALQTELREMRKELKSLRRERDGEKQQTADQRFRQSLSDTDKSLTDEGYPGFYIMRAAVVDELKKMVDDDPDNVIHDSPTGWAKIYKEKVWPTVSEHFTKVHREKTMDKKKADKKKANVVTIPGSSPKSAESEKDEWTFQDYVKMRRGSQVS